MVIKITPTGFREVVKKWISEDMTCKLSVSYNSRGECRIEVFYDPANDADLRALLRAAVGEIIELR
jgi:hypothetical protein